MRLCWYVLCNHFIFIDVLSADIYYYETFVLFFKSNDTIHSLFLCFRNTYTSFICLFIYLLIYSFIDSFKNYNTDLVNLPFPLISIEFDLITDHYRF